MKSYISHLECTVTAQTYPLDKPLGTSPASGKVLFPRYDLTKLRQDVDPKKFQSRPSNMWKYFELMPVQDPNNVITLGEGDTPLMHAQNLARKFGLENLYIKDEGVNPTGSFKARGLSAAVSKAKELNQMRLTMPTAGNAGSAMAAYAAKAGMEAHIFMPKDAPESNKIECTALGSTVHLIDGLIGDAGRISQEKAREEGLFDLSTLREPYRVEGKKTMGLELAEQLGWKTPDVIIYPTGGGTGIVGIWKAFEELRELGWIDSPQPKFVSIQAEGCQPLVRAFEKGLTTAEPHENASTLASGLRVPGVFADYIILDIIRQTGGTALAVSDREMLDAMNELASAEGIFAAPEGAATLVGLKKLIKQDFFHGHETIVLLNTGSGLKYLDVLDSL